MSYIKNVAAAASVALSVATGAPASAATDIDNATPQLDLHDACVNGNTNECMDTIDANARDTRNVF